MTADRILNFCGDIWSKQEEIQELLANAVHRDQFEKEYAEVFTGGSDDWKAIETTGGAIYDWRDDSTYIQEPDFFLDIPPKPTPILPIENARCLIKVGDSVTTDHIRHAQPRYAGCEEERRGARQGTDGGTT